MGNSLRCCLACVLPCGALDLIRIVHLNGYVEEITRPITAGEVLKANPNHVLSKPSSQGMVRRILLLSPETELKRGSIYFLIPTASLPSDKKKILSNNIGGRGDGGDLNFKKVVSSTKKKSIAKKSCDDGHLGGGVTNNNNCEFFSKEKKCSRRRDRRRSSSSGVWHPNLESILED